jgi:SAM-dependent methyltransferase
MFTKSAEFYDAIYSFKDYAHEVSLLHGLIQRHKRSVGNGLLDVACGTGGHIAFLKADYAVEGLDLDPGMLAVARRRFPDIPLYLDNMLTFDLGRRFDAVVCLFSSIGYVKTLLAMERAVANMALHLNPGGVLVVEPWFSLETFKPGTPHALLVDQPELKIARVNLSRIEGNLSILDFHYLVATPAGVEHFTERHELGLFSPDQYQRTLEAAGLETSYDPEGLTGRGLHIGVG